MADEINDLVSGLPERAWRQIEMAIRTGGTIVSEDGTLVGLKAGEYARLLQFVASLDTKKKLKGPPPPSDHFLKETGA